jgi:hypothetical protein
MIELAQKLGENGLTYTSQGSLYFRITRFTHRPGPKTTASRISVRTKRCMYVYSKNCRFRLQPELFNRDFSYLGP